MKLRFSYSVRGYIAAIRYLKLIDRWEAACVLAKRNDVIDAANAAYLSARSEAEVQTEIRLAAPKLGLQLFRNNVGVTFDATGRAIRYGLANESKEINKKIKSGDLIGWRPLIITQDMVGKTVALFVSIECKSQKKHAKIKKAQQAWADLVKKAGGLALILARGLEPSDLEL